MVDTSSDSGEEQRSRHAVRRTRLREFQADLTERLRLAASTPQTHSRLGILIGAHRYLLDLSEAGEIFSVPNPTPVPMTQPWFKGLFVARGNLHTLIDLGHFMGADPTPLNKNSRALAFNEILQLNASILVTRMLGLRNLDKLTVVPVTPSVQAWIGQIYEDTEGNQWTELRLSVLLQDERFLTVAA